MCGGGVWRPIGLWNTALLPPKVVGGCCIWDTVGGGAGGGATLTELGAEEKAMETGAEERV